MEIDNISKQPADSQQSRVSPDFPHKANLLMMGVGVIFFLGVGLLAGYLLWGNNRIASQNVNQQTQISPTSVNETAHYALPAVTNVTTPSQISIDWDGLAKGEYAIMNNYAKTVNGWIIRVYIMEHNPTQSIQNHVTDNKRSTHGDLMSVYWQKQLQINGYQAIIQEVFVNPESPYNNGQHGNTMDSYIVNIEQDTLAKVIGIPPIPQADRFDITHRLNQEYIDQFQDILSTFQFPQ